MNAPKKSRIWRKVLWGGMILLFLLLVAAAVVWNVATNEARKQIDSRLRELDLGDVQMGEVRLNPDGVTAEDISFTRPGSDSPWLTAQELKIEEPLSNLAAGGSDYDRIRIDDARVNLDLDELTGEPVREQAETAERPGVEAGSFDLADFQLPAGEVVLNNASVTLQQSGREDLTLEDLNLTLTGNDVAGAAGADEADGGSEIRIEGSARLPGGERATIAGSVDPQANRADLQLDAGTVSLDAEQWRRWPGVPDWLPNYVTADGEVTLEATVQKQPNSDFALNLAVRPQSLDLVLPGFDLKLELVDGEAIFGGRQIVFSDLKATTGGGGEIVATGDVSTAAFPVVTRFEATLDRVSVATLRRLVPDIPQEVVADTTGRVQGIVTIFEDLRSQIELQADGTSGNLRYGSIESGAARIDVDLDSLALTSDLELSELVGQIGLDSSLVDVPLGNVFETFELVDLQNQLGLAADVSGTLNMTLPLQTIDDLRTWTMLIDGTADRAMLRNQELQDLNADVRMLEGRLLMDPVIAAIPGETAAGSESAPALQVSIDWPISELAENQGRGTVRMVGEELPPQWLARVAAHDPDAPSVEPAEERFPAEELDEISGEINFSTTIEIDANAPDEIAHWKIEGAVTDSVLRARGQRLENLKATLAGRDGMLHLNEVTTRFSELGDLSGSLAMDLTTNQLRFATLAWSDVSLESLAALVSDQAVPVGGTTAGELQLEPVDQAVENRDEVVPDDSPRWPWRVMGTLRTESLSISGSPVRDYRFAVETNDSVLSVRNVEAEDAEGEFELAGSIDLRGENGFQVIAKVGRRELGDLLEFARVSSSVPAEVSDLRGTIGAEVRVAGTLQPLEWSTVGSAQVTDVFYGEKPLNNIAAEWKFSTEDWGKSAATFSIFGGEIQLVELSQSTPQRVAVGIRGLDAEQIAELGDWPVAVTGRLSGAASLNDWSLAETRWAEVKLRGAATDTPVGQFGDLEGGTEYRNQRVSYELNGQLLDGRLTSSGSTAIAEAGLVDTVFPVNVNINGARLSQLYARSNYFRSLREIEGELFATADFEISPSRPPLGSGRVGVQNLKWDRELLTRSVATRFQFGGGLLELDQLEADLNRGEISGRARIPVGGSASGSYELDVRKFDLQRLAQIALDDSTNINGLLDARFSGKIGRTLSGQGQIGLARAEIAGLSGQSLKVPVQFRMDPASGQGRIEMRRSQVRLFDGTVSGKAAVDFGTVLNVDIDANITNVETDPLINLFSGVAGQGQGRLNGRLQLNGRGIRSSRDLDGSFEGQLDRVQSFRLPLLQDLAVFLQTQTLVNRDFDSNQIRLRLNRGAIQIRELTFTNSLASIAITGTAWLDQRLDLAVATRIERFNQPTLLDEFVQSPLGQFPGTPGSFLARAAEFVSDRIVFVHVGGTVSNPAFRLDAGQQVREEVLRFFLREANLPSFLQNPDN